MKVYADRCSETSTTTGTGTYSLAGAVTGYRTFVEGVGSANTCDYCCTDGTNWETGLGTVTSGTPDTLARTSIYASSNGGAAVNWGAGTKSIFVTLSGGKIGALAALNAIDDASAALTDVTTNNASTSKHGFAPKGTGAGTTFLRDDLTWAAAGGGGAAGFRPGFASGKYYWAAPIQSDAIGTNAISANTFYAWPFYVDASTLFTKIGCEITAGGGAGKLVRLGIYPIASGAIGTLILDAGTVDANTVAIAEITISQTLASGWYVLCLVSDGTPTLRRNYPAAISVIAAANTTTVGSGGGSGAFTFAALPSTAPTITLSATALAFGWLRL